MNSTADKMYFLSDTHIGGDGVLNEFGAENELLQFLDHLYREGKRRKVELVIAGDFLGLWDIRKKEGINKFIFIRRTHSEIFKAFKKVSERIHISLIPGNHDHDLACFSEYPEMLKQEGIDLIQKPFLEKKFHGKNIWIEHGNRFDPFQKIERFGDINDTPYGYHIFRETILRVIGTSKRNEDREIWLTDLTFIHPMEIIPHWVLSNYFYRELAPVLRYIIAPFLILFAVSTVLLILAIGDRLGIINLPDIFDFTGYLGPVKYVANTIIIINFIFLIFFFLLSLVFKVVKRDFKESLRKYGIKSRKKIKLVVEAHYRQKTKRFFKENPQYDLFIFGHNHKAGIYKLASGDKSKISANPGTWNRTVFPIRSWFLLPSVYIPCFKLSYLTLEKKEGKVILALKYWPKKTESKLTRLERFSILNKNRTVRNDGHSLTL